MPPTRCRLRSWRSISAPSTTANARRCRCSWPITSRPSRLYVGSTGLHPGMTAVLFAAFDQDFGWVGDDVVFNVAFDPQTRTLTAHEFFDPAGDCGYAGTWAWRDYAFAMVSYRFQGR